MRRLARGRLASCSAAAATATATSGPAWARPSRRRGLAVVTSDNPRSEAPLAIIDDIVPGMAGLVRLDPDALVRRPAPSCYVVEPDRRSAIALAIRAAFAGDCVLIAGKGHEQTQIVGATRSHFSDQEEARRALVG